MRKQAIGASATRPTDSSRAAANPAVEIAVPVSIPTRPVRQSKTGKKQKNLFLSMQARELLAELALRMGISETAVVELLVREKATRDNVTVKL